MFPRDSGTELETRFLISERSFRSTKQKKTMLGIGRSNIYREEKGYKLAPYLDQWYCDEEEEYQLISEGDEELEESTEALE